LQYGRGVDLSGRQTGQGSRRRGGQGSVPKKWRFFQRFQ